MTFLELVERVSEELNGVPLSFTSVDLGKSGGSLIVADPTRRQIIRATQLAYDWIMDFSRHWEFLNTRGEIFATVADTREYTLDTLESVDWDSLYATKSGTTGRWPVYEMPYDAWLRQDRAEVPSSGYPLYLIHGPVDTWYVWPTPSEVWSINGDYKIKKTQLLLETDEPVWTDERYHDLIVWTALLHLKCPTETRDAAQRAFNAMWSGFLTEYLPPFRGASAQL